MADPATITLAVKAAVAAATDPNARKVIGGVIAAILSPLILIVVIIVCLLSGTAEHNNAAVDLCFNGGYISSQLPADYRQHIAEMQGSFSELDSAIADISSQIEDGNIDSIRVKSIFYALFFGSENLRMGADDYRAFADCFVRYEERTRTVTDVDEDGNEYEYEETYIVAIPLTSLPEIYSNLERSLGRTITAEDRANASEIYYRVLYGGSVPTYGADFDSWSDGLPLSTAPFIGVDGFCSPLGENWRSVVTSEFGYRIDPITHQSAGHSGLDMGAPKGTPIRAALDGTVYVVRYSATGYGYHVMIDHGGGFVTLYGHCSAIYVTEGQTVSAGDVIAAVGTTGRSTGNHLHFEVRIGGQKQNPRSYLP